MSVKLIALNLKGNQRLYQDEQINIYYIIAGRGKLTISNILNRKTKKAYME